MSVRNRARCRIGCHSQRPNGATRGRGPGSPVAAFQQSATVHRYSERAVRHTARSSVVRLLRTLRDCRRALGAAPDYSRRHGSLLVRTECDGRRSSGCGRLWRESGWVSVHRFLCSRHTPLRFRYERRELLLDRQQGRSIVTVGPDCCLAGLSAEARERSRGWRRSSLRRARRNV